MSVIQLLVMDPANRPDIAAIREAAVAEEPPYFPYDTDLESHTGFLPVTVDERPTGFEYYFSRIEEGELPPEATAHGSHQMVARTGGDMAEMLASLRFFRTAAKLSGAAYVYPGDGIIVPPNEVDAYLSSSIDLVKQLLTDA